MKQLTLKERQIMTKAFARRYQQATKKQKTLILNQFCSSTGYVEIPHFILDSGKVLIEEV